MLRTLKLLVRCCLKGFGRSMFKTLVGCRLKGFGRIMLKTLVGCCLKGFGRGPTLYMTKKCSKRSVFDTIS